jgi:hypothetical protein
MIPSTIGAKRSASLTDKIGGESNNTTSKALLRHSSASFNFEGSIVVNICVEACPLVITLKV